MQAFDDQCTGGNPLYPLVSEIREIYLKSFYGREAAQDAENKVVRMVAE